MIQDNHISLIYPSRGRPDIFFSTLKKWIDSCRKYEKVQWIISLDADDPSLPNYIYGMPQECQVVVNNNSSAVEAINYGATHAYKDLLIVISDDFEPFENWDYYLTEALFGKEDFICKTKDGLQPTLITLPIMDMAYYERFDYIYNPAYKHMWVDTEMTAVGHLLGKVLNLDLEFKHNHYTTGKFKKDAISLHNDATWSQGQNLFNERLKTNFGLADEDIVKPYSEIVWR